MKQVLVMIAAVVLVGCGKDEPAPYEPASPQATPEKLIADPIVEEAIRESL